MSDTISKMTVSRSLADRVLLVKRLLQSSQETYESIRTGLTEDEVRGKIENFVGAVPIPLALCGPIHLRGQFACGHFIVPMATLEGALVASYSRGAKILNECGGCETLVYGDYFSRAAQFTTKSLSDSAQLVAWCKQHESELRRLAGSSSSHISSLELSYEFVGTSVMVSIRATTGDAMGSNMLSKAIDTVAQYVRQHSGFVDQLFLPFTEDKKYIPLRYKGKRVIARAVLQRDVLARIARTTPEALSAHIRNYQNLLALHGSCSMNIHASNGMAAMFQAFGQDMAYIGECSQAVVDSHFVATDSLEVSITLPCLIIGTIGGGTGLPAFRATLEMVGCRGAGKAKKLAEIMAGMILAGEIGCGSAQCAHEFVRAHEAMGKNRPARL